MSLKKFPYGYAMERGKIIICEPEAEIIRNIFQNRDNGKSNYMMAKELFEAQTDGFSENIKKASSKISSILYDNRYAGAEDYPAIVDPEIFDKVQGMKGKQYAESSHTAKKSPEYSLKMRILQPTAYIPSKAVYEKEKELKLALRAENADADAIRQLILDIAAEKYNCIL